MITFFFFFACLKWTGHNFLLKLDAKLSHVKRGLDTFDTEYSECDSLFLTF